MTDVAAPPLAPAEDNQTGSSEASSSRRPSAYALTIGGLTATIGLAFPVCSYLVFGLGFDRGATASGLTCIFVGVLTSLLVAPWLPFPSLRGESSYRRLERMVYIWLILLAVVALTWEIPWMALRHQIAAARDELWAYTWWAYIDGGDTRYLDPDFLVFYVEGWADINGVLTLAFLYVWFKSKKTSVYPIYYFMFAAPLSIYPTVLYWVSELATGMHHVDTTSAINLYLKFGWSNAFWVIVPFFVLYWGKQTLERLYQARFSAPGD